MIIPKGEHYENAKEEAAFLMYLNPKGLDISNWVRLRMKIAAENSLQKDRKNVR